MKHTHSEYYITQQIRSEGAAWIAQQNFWLFGTARYYDGTLIQREQAERDCRHYFNTIDRQIISRRDYNEQRRLQRLVFIETGKNRVNTHIHFFIKGTELKQYRQIKAVAEANWTSCIAKASDCVVLDNIELVHERKHYCWKEFDSIRSETLYLPCCHLAKPKYT